MTRDEFDAVLKTWEESVYKAAYAAGEKAGAHSVRMDTDRLIQESKAAHLAQGKANGVSESLAIIEEAREAGRVMGVTEGTAHGKELADKTAEKRGFEKGYNSGRDAGYKSGRGDGYKNGWNDCVNSPPSAQKPK